MYCTELRNTFANNNTSTISTADSASPIPLAVLQRSLSDLLTAKAAAEQKLAACKTPTSSWARQYREEVERTRAAAEHTRALIHQTIRRPELEAAAALLGDRPVSRYRVCYPLKTASGKYPEVLDLMKASEVLLHFLEEALLLGEPLQTGDAFRCYLPDNTLYIVEVL